MSDPEFSEDFDGSAAANDEDADSTSSESFPEETTSFGPTPMETDTPSETTIFDDFNITPTPSPTGSSTSRNIDDPFTFTLDGTPTTVESGAPFTLTFLGEPTVIPASQYERFPHICQITDAEPVAIQDAASWNETGCLQGFLCVMNDYENPPEYCPPTAQFQKARLSGIILPAPMGVLEPFLCPAGQYCPPPGRENFTCPEKHYCPPGSFEPKKCFLGAFCPEGSVRNMGFTPLVILLLVDLILVTMAIIFKLKQKYKQRSHRQRRKAFRNSTQTPAYRVGEMRALNSDTEYYGIQDGSFALETGMAPTPARRPTGFHELAAMDTEYSVVDDLHDPAPAETTDLHLFVQSLKKCLGANQFGLSFEFENLQFQPKKSPKPILADVSGMINAGSLWGVMGASGAGKSTFVNVLMGKTSHTGGVTKVNGVPGNIKKYKKIIGYVPQDDIVLPELTVRENILHSARIRLPSTWSDKEIQHHVDILISCLQLSHVKDSLVGSPGAPVISGGQRKRVSIGMELAAAPMAVFLDEPTSGLDATAAASIMSTLKALTRLGMTIVVIIHQPRQEIFESLDSLVLLGSGRMIYQGPEREMQPHFESLGFNFPPRNNPADTMGDIIAGEGRLYKTGGDASVTSLIDYWHEMHTAGTPDLKKSPNIPINEIHSLQGTLKSRGAAFYKQVYFCFIRSLIQQYRMKSSFFFELGVGGLAGFLIGLAYLNQKGQNFQGVFHEPYSILSSAINYSGIPQMALLVGIAIGLTASAPGVKVFGEEKLVYWREAAAGHNRFAYYLGKVLSTAPRMFLACFHFSTMFLLLSTPQISWGAAFAANILYFYCIYGLASCISMVSRREDGPLLAVMGSLIVGVLNGGSPSLEQVRSWHLAWLWRASPGTWLGEAYFDRNIQPYEYLFQIDVARQVIGYRLGHFGLDLGLLAAIGTIYRIVAFLGLRFMYPAKQR